MIKYLLDLRFDLVRWNFGAATLWPSVATVDVIGLNVAAAICVIFDVTFGLHHLAVSSLPLELSSGFTI